METTKKKTEEEIALAEEKLTRYQNYRRAAGLNPFGDPISGKNYVTYESYEFFPTITNILNVGTEDITIEYVRYEGGFPTPDRTISIRPGERAGFLSSEDYTVL